MKPKDIEGFEIKNRDYTFYRLDCVAIAEKVPYLRDPITNELYLHACVAKTPLGINPKRLRPQTSGLDRHDDLC